MEKSIRTSASPQVIATKIEGFVTPFSDREYTLFHIQTELDLRLIYQSFNPQELECTEDFTLYGPGWYMFSYDDKNGHYTLENLKAYAAYWEEELYRWKEDVRRIDPHSSLL